MKRFWEQAEPVRDEAGWTVRLDGKPVRIPGAEVLLLPTQALAVAVAAEWSEAGRGPDRLVGEAELPLTRLAGTAQVRIAPDPEPVALALARYGETDLLCYRAEGPVSLVARQAALWQPWLDWAAAAYGAPLLETAGIRYVAQPPESLARLAAAVAGRSALALAALGVAVPALGSLVLGLAVADLALDAGMAYDLSVLDDTFQAEQWGDDWQAASRRAAARAELVSCGRCLVLASG